LRFPQRPADDVVPSTYIVPLGCVECGFAEEGCTHCYDSQHESVLAMNALSDMQDTRPSGLPGMLRETSSLLGAADADAAYARDFRAGGASATAQQKLELVDAELDQLRHEIQLMVETAAGMMPEELADLAQLESITVALSRPGQWDDENFEYSVDVTPPVRKPSTPKAAAAKAAAIAAMAAAQATAVLTVKHEPNDGFSHEASVPVSTHDSALSAEEGSTAIAPAAEPSDAPISVAASPSRPMQRADDSAAAPPTDAVPPDASSSQAAGALSGSSEG
jgi:hypothetical protein